MTTAVNGTYQFRTYMTFQRIIDLLHLPEGYDLRQVLVDPERDALVFFINTPTEPKYFVPENEIIPIESPAILVRTDDKGEHIQMSFPQFDED